MVSERHGGHDGAGAHPRTMVRSEPPVRPKWSRESDPIPAKLRTPLAAMSVDETRGGGDAPSTPLILVQKSSGAGGVFELCRNVILALIRPTEMAPPSRTTGATRARLARASAHSAILIFLKRQVPKRSRESARDRRCRDAMLGPRSAVLLQPLAAGSRGMRNKATPSARKAKLDKEAGRRTERFLALIKNAAKKEDHALVHRIGKEAKKTGVSAAVLDRALHRTRNRDAMDEKLYEATLPGGACLLILALTDKPSRTAPQVRHALTEGGGALGTAGSVMWAFEPRGRLGFVPEDEEQAAAILDHALGVEGVEDVREAESAEDGGNALELVEVITDPSALNAARDALADAGFTAALEEPLAYVPSGPRLRLDGEAHAAAEAVVSHLLELEDVEQVWSNLADS